MDNLNPEGQFRPRTLGKILTENRGSTSAPPAPPAAPPATPPAGSPPAAPPPAAPPIIPDPTKPPAPGKWYDDLPQDFKDNPNIQKFKTKEDLAKSYLELSSLLGHEKIALPKDDDDAVAISLLNKALGVPDEAAGYDVGKPEEIEGFEGIQFGLDQFKELAFKHKLTGKQAAGVMADYVQMLKDVKAQSEKAFQEEITGAKQALTKEWGMAYESKVKLAQAVMNKFAGNKEVFDHINAKIGADPVALKWLASIGEKFSEGSLGDLGTPKAGFTKTPAEARTEYDRIMNDPNDIYWSGVRNNLIVSEPVRRERITYVEGLLRMMNG